MGAETGGRVRYAEYSDQKETASPHRNKPVGGKTNSRAFVFPDLSPEEQ